MESKNQLYYINIERGSYNLHLDVATLLQWVLIQAHLQSAFQLDVREKGLNSCLVSIKTKGSLCCSSIFVLTSRAMGECPLYSKGRRNMDPLKVGKWVIPLGGSIFLGTKNPKGEARLYHQEQTTISPPRSFTSI